MMFFFFFWMKPSNPCTTPSWNCVVLGQQCAKLRMTVGTHVSHAQQPLQTIIQECDCGGERFFLPSFFDTAAELVKRRQQMNAERFEGALQTCRIM
mmetsp:Transcript_30902/g.98584  ORF Transcript_30902/g.98584 Transcript_30902/m.98584 type:complete len:96 (+) Transcript_30902:785-1072(+)